MNSAVEEMLRENPRLEDISRLYEMTLQFSAAVQDRVSAMGLTRTAYRADALDLIFALFQSVIELPEGSLSPLRHAMELGEIDFTRLPLGESPAFSLPYPEDDLSMLLFLLSRPFFRALRHARRFDGRTWEEGRCPACNARPVVTWPGDARRLQTSCSYCGTTGFLDRDGCPVCRNVDPSKQTILSFEGEEGFKFKTCERCKSYVKTIDAAVIFRLSPDVADLASLPHDIAVQEKGYARRAPNPVGMTKMSSRG